MVFRQLLRRMYPHPTPDHRCLFPVPLTLAAAAILMGGIVLPLRSQPAGSPGNIAAYKRLSLAQLMDVEVTSVSRRAERLLDTPSAIQVVTGEDLRRSGAIRLPTALRLFSNLAVAQVDARQWAITARGFNNTVANKLLVLLDGRTLYTPLYAGVFWDAQDTFMPDLDRIEVISGPGATQWGSNAVNGVINITTKNARDTQGGLFWGGLGTEVKRIASVRYGGALAPDLHYRVYAKRVERDGSLQPDGQDARDDWWQMQTGFRMDWDAQAGNVLTLQGDIYTGRVGVLTTRDIKMEGGNLLGRWSRSFSPDSGIKLQAYFDRTFRRIPGSITEDLKIYDFDFQHQTPVGVAHQLVWGANLRTVDDMLVNPPTLAFLPAEVYRKWYSFFIQDTVAMPNDAWRVTLGSKFEHNPYTGMEIQPSLRAAWKVRPSLLLWGAISRAVRSPSRIDRELFAPASPPFVFAGGPNFVSEKLIAVELGLRSQPHPQFNYSVSTFFHDYDDLRSLESAGIGVTMLANGIVGKSYGAELTAEYAPTDNWRLRLGYTELRVVSRTKPGSQDRTSVRSQSLDPNQHLSFASLLNLSDSTFFDITVRYVSPLRNQQVPGYTELDARLAWQPNGQLEFFLTGQNLLHARHREFGAPATGRDIERNVMAGMTWRF